MNCEQAVHAITKRGFTDRQAQFLVLVARHSGVCVMRQYFERSRASSLARRPGSSSTSSCGSASSRPTTARTVADASTTCAIGRSTRRSASRTAGFAGRLACLALSNGSCFWTPFSRTWTASGCRPAPRRCDYFSKRGIATNDYPHRTVRQGDQRLVRHFPDRLPIGVHPSGHVVFVYLYADPTARRVSRLPAAARAAPRAPPRVDASHRGSTAPGRRSGPAPEDRVGTARIALERAAADRGAVVLRSSCRRPGWLERPCRSAPL